MTSHFPNPYQFAWKTAWQKCCFWTLLCYRLIGSLNFTSWELNYRLVPGSCQLLSLGCCVWLWEIWMQWLWLYLVSLLPHSKGHSVTTDFSYWRYFRGLIHFLCYTRSVNIFLNRKIVMKTQTNMAGRNLCLVQWL